MSSQEHRVHIHKENAKYQNDVTQTARINTMNDINNTINDVDEINQDVCFMIASVNECMYHFTEKGYNVTVLNFANAQYVGGGVEHGALAQEEELCRTSPMLYNSLLLFGKKNRDSHLYVYDNWSIWDKCLLFTSSALFRRYDTRHKIPYDIILDDKAYDASIITAAAPNWSRWSYHKVHDSFTIRTHNNQIIRKDAITETQNIKRMIEHIYNAPNNVIEQTSLIEWRSVEPLVSPINVVQQENNILILGPWGCGAFAPSVGADDYRDLMMTQFAKVIKESKKRYLYICFSFLNDKNDSNFDSFMRIFNQPTYFGGHLFQIQK